MKFLAVFLVLAALYLLVLAKEERSFLERAAPLPLPVGWKRLTSLALTESTREINLIFALKNRNMDKLDEIFWAVSDPKNEKYGQHLSLAQLAELTGATDETLNEILTWLASYGVTGHVLQSRDLIKATVSVALASKMFNVEYHSYIHTPSGMEIDTTVGPYSLPSNIADKLDLVSGIVGFPYPFYPHYNIGKPLYYPDQIDPTVIRTRYNVSNDTVCTNKGNAQAVAEFQSQFYSPTDLQKFWTDYVDYAPFTPVYQIVGTNNADRPGIEASLDIEYIMSVAPECETWFYSYASFNFLDDLLTWVGDIENETSPPWVHSVSYGEQGNYPSDAYVDNLNDQFQKIGARGISIIFASGDSGAGCGGLETRGGISSVPSTSSCDCELYPSFPATCPYVISVGATRFLTGNSGPEGAVQAFKSGGGFAPDFAQPDYQEDAVEAYLDSGVELPPSCSYNASGRATPDVAALGDEKFQVVRGGRTYTVGGTSASAPSFSAIMSLLNDIRLNDGKSTLGFLGPWLYQTSSAHPDAFFDVTIGDNENSLCCRSGGIGGFECAAGWDPVTGLGTPNFAVLKTIV